MTKLRALQPYLNQPLPDEWKLIPLYQIIDLAYGEGLSDENRVAGNIPVFGSNGIVGYHNHAIVKGPAIIVGRKGSAGEVTWSEVDCFPIDTTFYVQPLRENLDFRWLYYQLVYVNFTRLNAATGVPGLSRSDALDICIPFFNKTEQSRISKILQQVDYAIKDIELTIEKAQLLKKALMQNLLSGRLKPDGTWRKPDEFYVDEKFGRVPKGWATPKVKDIVDYLRRGRSPKYTESSKYVPVINQKCIEWGRINFEYVKCHDPQVKIPDEFFLLDQDILVNSTGTGTIGRIAMFHGYDYPCFADGHVTIIRPSKKFVQPRFLKYYLMSYNGQRHLESFCYSGSTNQIELSRSYFLNMRVPIPANPDEQTVICDRIELSQKYIECSERKINTLKRLKKSLMQNLLTGKIRVQVE